jgi:hypothetical protein
MPGQTGQQQRAADHAQARERHVLPPGEHWQEQRREPDADMNERLDAWRDHRQA